MEARCLMSAAPATVSTPITAGYRVPHLHASILRVTLPRVAHVGDAGTVSIVLRNTGRVALAPNCALDFFGTHGRAYDGTAAYLGGVELRTSIPAGGKLHLTVPLSITDDQRVGAMHLGVFFYRTRAGLTLLADAQQTFTVSTTAAAGPTRSWSK